MAISSWQDDLRRSICDPGMLLDAVVLMDQAPALARHALRKFPLRVPPAFAAEMQAGDPGDPLLRQVLPVSAEDREVPGFSADPLGEHRRQPAPGLLYKYPGRILLVVTGACAIHCRYCFRRHFPYPGSNPARDDWRPALDFIRSDETINEVILSGGDPLTLSDDALARLIRLLESVPHLRRLRIHSRMPVVVPARITPALLASLERSRLQAVVVIHANHAREIGGEAGRSLAALRGTGLALLNQSVLLKGVNDDAGVLADLSERLFEAGVLPYYLHMLDPVAGAAHFQVDEARARAIMKELRRRLPGYLVPRLVREEEGELAKTPL